MFVGDEAGLDVSFAVARKRLARLAEGGVLISASQAAYGRGTGGAARVRAAGLSKLVRVQTRELSGTDSSVGLAIRWEATGPGGGLFPVLDADLRLAPAGEHGTVLTMASAYRPPLGWLGETLDRAILHKIAAATIRSFLTQVAAQIEGQPGADRAGASGVDRAGGPSADRAGVWRRSGGWP